AGFCNWKKAIEKLNLHQATSCHRECVEKFSTLHLDFVSVQLNQQFEHDQEIHRNLFMRELSTILFLARQGLALRGPIIEQDGNLYQLLKLGSEDCPELTILLNDHAYISHDVINEILKLMGHQVLRSIINKISNAKWYTIIADETRDISNHEQLVICIIWVDDCYNAHEDPIGLYEIPSQDAQTITNVLKDALSRCGIPLANCRGQAYDDGSNMSGKLNGVAAKLQEEVPSAIYVHCLLHCLNLAVQDICKTQKTGSTEKPNLIHEALAFMHKVAKEICQDSNDSAATVRGLMYQMDAFDTYFSLKLAYLIFSASDHLATQLQSKNTIAQDATLGVSTLCDYYSSQSPKEYYRQQYFEILELVRENVDSHCGSEKYGIVQDIETLLLEACNGKISNSEVMKSVQDMHSSDLDIEQLKIQLKMLPNFITASKVNIKKITSIRTLCDKNQMTQSMFIDVLKLLLLYLTVPAATAECTFSTLRHLKT
uniref:DUF4371 domain-containing protein n=1 Tax=Latimeria chalumnae TaxID=7897 RepID=H3AMU6_LATCH